MSSIQPYLPDESHYLAGKITKDGEVYEFTRLNENPSPDNDWFLAHLGALKIENHTEDRLILTVAWAWSAATGENIECVTASVPHGTWEAEGVPDPGRYGIWAALPRQLTSVRVSIEGMQLRYEDSLVDYAEFQADNVSGTIILFDEGKARSRTRLFRHVYVQGGKIAISNETEHPWTGTVTWKDDDGNEEPKPLGKEVKLGRHEYPLMPPDTTGSWYPATITLENQTPYDKTQEFKLFDVDGKRVEIVQETNAKGDWSVAGPYVITSEDDEVVVYNELLSSVDVWPMGYKVGNENSSPPVTSPPVVSVRPKDRRSFTMVDGGSTANDKIPYRGPGPGQSTSFQRQSALNWLADGDPKVVIRQNDCGSG